MNAAPNRWFRFSLRTLLILITVVCCYLAYETSVVRHRRSELARLRSSWAFNFTTVEEVARRYPGGPPSYFPPVKKPPSVSLVRQWLGDQPIQYIGYYSHMVSEAERQRVARIFPEAQMMEDHPPLEPCHPGCFPRGTLVETPTGQRPIETIGVGEILITVSPGGETTAAAVQSVFVTTNRLWQIETEAGVLFTTEVQPLVLAGGEAIPAGQLQPGNLILRREGNEQSPVHIRSVAPTQRIEQVINLVLGGSQNFIAGGYVARGKPPAASGTAAE
jgi:hypothetical protein